MAQPIVLLEGVFDAAQLAIAARMAFDLVVHHPDQLALLEQQAARNFVVWLKVDTGMNRLGFRIEDARDALARLRRLSPALREIRLLTHLACADERDPAVTQQQLDRFAPLAYEAGLTCSIANSAGLLAFPAARAQWVRPGLALYGASPFRASHRRESRPHAGDDARDDGHCDASRGTGRNGGLRRHVACGPRHAGRHSGGRLWRWITAQPAERNAGAHRGPSGPLVGRVSMDMIAVDVTDIADVAVGERAVLWGPGLPVEEIAALAGTIPYELLCGISQRVPIELVSEPDRRR